MRYFKYIILCLSFSTTTLGQVSSSSFDLLLKSMLKETVPQISVAQLAAQKNSPLILDARERDEFLVSHIKGAKWVGYDTFDPKKLKNIPKTTPIVIYCSIGVRSEKIGEKLIKLGFSDVKNLYGSIFEWVNQGHPVYDSTNKPTQKVHAYSKTWGVWLNKGEKVYEFK